MTLTMTRFTGQELLDYVDANPSLTHTERCTGAGYLKNLDNGSQGCAFTDYFEAIIEAKGIDPSRDAFADGAWYDKLSSQDKDLYDKIEDMCPEFTKLAAEQCQEFMDELSDLGITTAQQFEDALFYQFDSWNAESEFAEYITTELNCVELPEYVVIDWQATWDRNLCYDFSTIEFDGETYFFHNHF